MLLSSGIMTVLQRYSGSDNTQPARVPTPDSVAFGTAASGGSASPLRYANMLAGSVLSVSRAVTATQLRRPEPHQALTNEGVAERVPRRRFEVFLEDPFVDAPLLVEHL